MGDPKKLCPLAKIFEKIECSNSTALEAPAIETPEVDPKALCPLVKIFEKIECSNSTALVDPKMLCPLVKLFVAKECTSVEAARVGGVSPVFAVHGPHDTCTGPHESCCPAPSDDPNN